MPLWAKWTLGLVAALVAVLGYLLATGEKGLSSRTPGPARSIEVTRLGETETAELGWNHDAVSEVFAHAATLSTDALVISTRGKRVAAFGDQDAPRAVHSIRKAFLSAIVGQHVGSGETEIPLDASLKDLSIDDALPALTDLQRQATVLHLLKSTSGINHPAAAEAGLTAEKNRRLGDGDNQPGTVWAYNNWDYNALTTIFEVRTGLTVAQAFGQGIAAPIGLRDFSETDVSYSAEPEISRHRAASFRMSARDLETFGQLYLDRGMADGRPVVPASWVDRVTDDFTETGRDDLRWAHGYLWWLPDPDFGLPQGTFWAWGLGYQALFVIPAWETVIVHQADTTEFLKRFEPIIASGEPVEPALEKLVLSCRDRDNRRSEYCVEHRFTLRPEFDELITLIVDARL